MTQPPLDVLLLFTRVARHLSFRRAAAEAGVSPSSLSERIRALEDALGTRLLNRTTRSVGLTEAGEALLARVDPALETLSSALAAAGRPAGEPTGRLRINAPAPAAHLVLAPMIAPFLLAHPGVSMEIAVDDGFSDVIGLGFDAGVRYGESLARDMIAVPLGGPQRFVVAASPALIARVGAPTRPEDLLERPCIRIRLPGGVIGWEFERRGETVRIQPTGPLTSTDPFVNIAAARDGLGFVATFRDWIAEDLEAGRLVTVLEDWTEPFEGPFLYYPSRRHTPPPLAAFLTFLKARRRGTSDD